MKRPLLTLASLIALSLPMTTQAQQAANPTLRHKAGEAVSQAFPKDGTHKAIYGVALIALVIGYGTISSHKGRRHGGRTYGADH